MSQSRTRLMNMRAGRVGAAALLALVTAIPASRSAQADSVQPAHVTEALIEAAKKEGKVVFYAAEELRAITNVVNAFQAKYPGVTVQLERSGGERIYQRIGQEYASGIHAVDVVTSSDLVHFHDWKEQGLLAPYLPEDVQKWPAEQRDPDGLWAADTLTFASMGYNTRLVKAEAAPKNWNDLLDPKWKGKMVKANPGYSGVVMTGTFALSRALGWEYFEKLAKQQVLQVQSATEPPKKIEVGERAVMVDGGENAALLLMDGGAPIALVYPPEGTPAVVGGGGIMKDAPHPSAARLFASFLFSREGQQVLVDSGFRSFHPDVAEKNGRKALHEIKLLNSDAVERMKAMEEIKDRYARYFGL